MIHVMAERLTSTPTVVQLLRNKVDDTTTTSSACLLYFVVYLGAALEHPNTAPLSGLFGCAWVVGHDSSSGVWSTTQPWTPGSMNLDTSSLAHWSRYISMCSKVGIAKPDWISAPQDHKQLTTSSTIKD